MRRLLIGIASTVALLAGAGRGLKEIDVELVDSTYQELGVIQAVA